MSLNTSTSAQDPSERRNDLDWLRVFAVVLLIYFHTAAVFYRGELGEFYITNAVTSPTLSLLILLIHQWHMPLFFFLSGSASWFSLSKRSSTQYLKERFQRLLIPFVFGTLTLVPPQVYVRLLTQSTFDGSYLEFYPHFFQGIRPTGNFEWAHLWFVIYLFVFSLVALPLFMYLKRTSHLKSFLIQFLAHPISLFALALPLAIIEACFRPKWLGFQNLYDDWANVFLYLSYFIYGYVLCENSQFKLALDRYHRSLMGIAIVGMLILLGLWITDLVPERGYSPLYMSYQAFRGMNTWCWVIAFLSLGQRHLNFRNPVLNYASEAAYPFYILHQTVVVCIAFYAINWKISVPGKFAIISTAALIATIVFYELFVRRWTLTRWLFGLKSARS